MIARSAAVTPLPPPLTLPPRWSPPCRRPGNRLTPRLQHQRSTLRNGAASSWCVASSSCTARLPPALTFPLAHLQVHKENLTKGVANPTMLFRFALPDASHEAGLPVASCLLVRAPIGSEKPDGSRAWVIR